MEYNKLLNKFIAWIKDVEEDTPLPYECEVICFGLTKNGMIFFSASEYVPQTVVPCEFYPLEAQCFDNTIKVEFVTFKKLVQDFCQIKHKILNINKVCYGKEFEMPIII